MSDTHDIFSAIGEALEDPTYLPIYLLHLSHNKDKDDGSYLAVVNCSTG